MANNVLAKLKIKTLDARVLKSLVQRQAAEDELLLQDHYNVSGSLNEFVSTIRTRFREWRTEQDGDCSYAVVLAIMPSSVIFYTTNWMTDKIAYYQLDFSESAGAITFAEEPTEVNVRLVVEETGIKEVEQAAMPNSATAAANAVTPQGDAVNDANIVETAGPSGTLTGTTNPPAPGSTEANSAAPSAPGPAAVATADIDSTAGINAGIGAGTAAVEDTDALREHNNDASGPITSSADAASDEMVLIQGSAHDKHNESMSYIESLTQSDRTDAAGNKLLRLKGIATRADLMNSHGQVYPRSVWEKNLPLMNQQAAAGKFIGEVEHPDADNGLMQVAIKYDKFWLEGSDLWFQATVVPTQHGKHIEALVAAGVKLDLSTRGNGTLKQGKWRGKDAKIVQDNYVCTHIDAVLHGASHGSHVTETFVQSADQGASNIVPNTNATAETSAQKRVEVLAQTGTLEKARAQLLAEAPLSQTGKTALANALNKATTADELVQAHDTMLPHLQAAFPAESADADAEALNQASTWTPQFFVKKSQDELAPQTVGSLFDKLVENLPDKYPGVEAVAPQGDVNYPSYLLSPKKACKRILQNIAELELPEFSGSRSALGLLALEQGKVERARDILKQSLSTGATTAADNAMPGGAPTSNVYIYPLIVRLYPKLILQEIASIQPLDRPAGKMFFLDHYRTEDPSPGDETRMDVNTSSSPFNSSYADGIAEGGAAKLIRMKLSSVDVTSKTKKLQAQWTIEEAQDLRAYHNLDAAQLLMAGVVKEIALEWNQEVIDDMITQASGSSRTFRKTAPSGFTQPEWDKYIWTYIEAMSNDIFAKRNGGITHLVCGVDAALALAKGLSFVTDVNGAGSSPEELELYPGMNVFPMGVTPTGMRVRIFKTNFWPQGSTNGAKIMCLRRGSEFFDTPYIFSPYVDYVAPMHTTSEDFTQRIGVMSRAAKKVVVSDAIGYLSIASGTGVPL